MQEQQKQLINAWAAGIIDGEGCVRWKHNKHQGKNKFSIYTSPEIVVGMTHEPTIKLLHEHFSCGHTYTRHRIAKNPKHNDLFVWGVSSGDAVRVAQETLPFMLLKNSIITEFLKWRDISVEGLNITYAERLSYYAGLFDGEAHIGSMPQHGRGVKTQGIVWKIPRIGVEMVDEPLIQAIQAFFKLGSIHKRKSRGQNILPTFTWIASHEPAREVLAKIQKFSITKYKTIEEVLALPYINLKRGPQKKTGALK